jgi:hypothetical protein
MTEDEDMVRLTISIPASLRKELKIKAVEKESSFTREVILCLKRGAAMDRAATPTT